MRLRLLDHAIPALCLILVSSPCLVLADFPYLGFAEPYTDPQCLDGYASAVRYGSPGLWTSFGVVGFTGSSSSDGANYTRVPWTDVVLQTDVHQSWVNIITTIHRSDEDVPLPAVRTTRGDEICVDVTHSAVEDESGIVPDTYVNVTLCTLIIDFSISSNGQTASLMYNSSFIVTYYNISMTEGVTVLSSDVAWSSSISDEYIDCRLWLNNLVAMGIATFLSTLIPILIYWYCPPAVANRKNLPPLRTRAPGQSQLAFVCLRTWDKFLLACTDSYIWGSFCFLAAAVIYIWGRQAPDYLNSHPEFTNVYWVVSAGFYVHSAAFYHMGYDQGTEKPALADLIECYCNTWGSLGFVVSAVMYMWYDFNNMTRTTNLFELGMYWFWMIEAFANTYSGYMGWYEDHKPLKGRTICEYVVMTIRAVVSPGFFANVGSFLGTFLYLISSSILSNVRTERAYLDYDDMINTWEPQGFVPPTYGYEASPDTLNIQVAADFCYLVSSVFYMYQAWIWFDPRELEEDSYAAISTPSDGTLADDASGVQLVSSPRNEDAVTVTLLSSESSKKGEYGSTEPVVDAVELYDVKRAHIVHLRWLCCCGWRKKHS